VAAVACSGVSVFAGAAASEPGEHAVAEEIDQDED
jgi:hypothetical protein